MTSLGIIEDFYSKQHDGRPSLITRFLNPVLQLEATIRQAGLRAYRCENLPPAQQQVSIFIHP